MVGKWPDSPETRDLLKAQAKLTNRASNLYTVLIVVILGVVTCVCVSIIGFLLITGGTFAALLSALPTPIP